MRSIIVMGRRRQGKSTLALRLALTYSELVVIWDPNNQYKEWPKLTVSEIETAMLEQAERAQSEHREALILRFVPVAGDDFDDEFEQLTSMLWGWEQFTLIVDEASTVQNFAKMHRGLNRLLRQAPASVQVIQTGHRPTDFHTLGRALCTDIFIFHSDQSNDLKKIAESWDESLATLVPRLGIYECVHYWLRNGGRKAISLWSDPRAWFIQIGRGEVAATASEPRNDPTVMMTGVTPADEDPILSEVIDNAG